MEKQENSNNSSTLFSFTNSVMKTENYLLSQQIQPITSSVETGINKTTMPLPLNSISSFGISKGEPITMNSLTDSIFDEKKQELLNNDFNKLKNLTNKMGTKFNEDILKSERRVNGAPKQQTGTFPSSDLRQLADAARAEIINSQAKLKKEKSENLIKKIEEIIPNQVSTNNDVKMMECDSSVPSPKPIVLLSVGREVEKVESIAKLDDIDNKINLNNGNF